MFVVASGELGVPVVCWAPAGRQARRTRNAADENASVVVFVMCLSSCDGRIH
jgi:hypothetical protein